MIFRANPKWFRQNKCWLSYFTATTAKNNGITLNIPHDALRLVKNEVHKIPDWGICRCQKKFSVCLHSNTKWQDKCSVSCRIIYKMVFNLLNVLLRCLSFLFLHRVASLCVYPHFIIGMNIRPNRIGWTKHVKHLLYSLINSLESRKTKKNPFVFCAHRECSYLKAYLTLE